MKRFFITLTTMLVAFMANAQSCPDDNHPHAIDLGLPSGTRWACCNVGASTPEGSGGYYAWGETEEKEIYDWNTYLHCDGSRETCHDLGLDIAGTEYDVAHVQWGSSWVMPSLDQIKELINKCSCLWTKRNGVGGDLFTGPNGGTIFLPEANEWRNNRNKSDDSDDYNDGLSSEADPLPDAGYYWASTRWTSNQSHANCILCSYGYAYWDSFNDRNSGLTVRPVFIGSDATGSNDISIDSQVAASSLPLYDLTGRRISDSSVLPKGVYIQGGKKYLVR